VSSTSRRSFLGAGLAAPALASVRPEARALPQARGPAQEYKFTYGTLGKTGLRVTRMAFGCMTTSDPSVIERAADMGINFFDTARVYQGGNNERMVGAALRKYRDKVYIASKTKAEDRKTALADLETSLRELQTDHLDVWYLHSRSSPSMVNEEVLEAQRIAKRDGKIRFAGVSFHDGHREMIPAMMKLNHFDVFLISYNFTMDAWIEPLIEQARKANIGMVAMKGLAGGVRPTVSVYKVPADRLNRLNRAGAAVAAIKWVLKNPYIDTIIPSIVDNDQLEENIRAMAAPFTEADARLLAARLEEIRPYYCRMCGNCKGVCPKGMPVSDVLRFLMYAEGYGQFGLGRENYQSLPAEVRSIRCAECGSCAVQCPNGVRVAERLMRAQEVFG
jgi:predicted aldo/keto reductase-like oxidoreductase